MRDSPRSPVLRRLPLDREARWTIGAELLAWTAAVGSLWQLPAGSAGLLAEPGAGFALWALVIYLLWFALGGIAELARRGCVLAAVLSLGILAGVAMASAFTRSAGPSAEGAVPDAAWTVAKILGLLSAGGLVNLLLALRPYMAADAMPRVTWKRALLVGAGMMMLGLLVEPLGHRALGLWHAEQPGLYYGVPMWWPLCWLAGGIVGSFLLEEAAITDSLRWPSSSVGLAMPAARLMLLLLLCVALGLRHSMPGLLAPGFVLLIALQLATAHVIAALAEPMGSPES